MMELIDYANGFAADGGAFVVREFQAFPSADIDFAGIGLSRRPAACSSVDLQDPDGPMRPTISPGKISISAPDKTVNSDGPDR